MGINSDFLFFTVQTISELRGVISDLKYLCLRRNINTDTDKPVWPNSNADAML